MFTVLSDGALYSGGIVSLSSVLTVVTFVGMCLSTGDHLVNGVQKISLIRAHPERPPDIIVADAARSKSRPCRWDWDEAQA